MYWRERGKELHKGSAGYLKLETIENVIKAREAHNREESTYKILNLICCACITVKGIRMILLCDFAVPILHFLSGLGAGTSYIASV
jgi:hypothetical protein